jgi:geranylgeranyl diphosphate synthase type II
MPPDRTLCWHAPRRREGAPTSPYQDQCDSTPPGDDWQRWYAEQRAAVDAAISSHLNTLKLQNRPHPALRAALEYSLSLPGKRLRPILALECCRAAGADAQAALPAALAIECVHTFALIHDDLPAMDDDDLRRGLPTCHRVFGEARAILAGDWLLAHAFELLADQPAAMLATLADGAADMISGQAADVEGEREAPSIELVRYIHEQKTARLIECACRLGGLAARADTKVLEAFGRFGRSLGLAFQIVDDLLDLTGSTEATGKRVGKDAGRSKQTYPGVLGAGQSRVLAEREAQQAVAALEPLGERAERLCGLAEYVLRRDR